MEDVEGESGERHHPICRMSDPDIQSHADMNGKEESHRKRRVQTKSNHLHRLEDNKVRLLTHDRTPPATLELGDAVAASDEDAQEPEHGGTEEESEFPARAQGHRLDGKLMAVLVHRHEHVASEDCEDQEREDLEGETGDHDVFTNGKETTVFGCGGRDRTTSAL